jgi:hypothetical protein
MRRLHLLLLAPAVFGWSGCAGYKLGPSNGERAGALSVQVSPFENKTIEPRLGESLTFALRRQIQRDGTYRLQTGNDSDVLVTGTILKYERHTLSLQPRDALSPRDYRLTITAQITARERLGGKVLLDRKVQGYSDIRISDNLGSAERQALPLVAEDVARNATALLVDGSW